MEYTSSVDHALPVVPEVRAPDLRDLAARGTPDLEDAVVVLGDGLDGLGFAVRLGGVDSDGSIGMGIFGAKDIARQNAGNARRASFGAGWVQLIG